MSNETNVSFPNVSGLKISISNLELYPRETNYANETISFSDLTIEEDMFAESIFGSINFIDSTPNLSLLNQININDKIIISLNGDTFEFGIIDINVTSDLASQKLVGPESHPTKILVRFASQVFLNANFNFVLPQGFLGKISLDQNNEEQVAATRYVSEVPGITFLKKPEDDDYASKYKDLSISRRGGFLQSKIAPILGNKPLKADPTFNDIWLKEEPVSYPYSKINSQTRLSQLMNYICEYAVDLTNSFAVNFFFWEDLYQWNFRSIESILSNDYKDAKDKDLPQFSPTTDENSLGAIVSFEVLNNVSILKLKNAGAYASEYIRIKPDWRYHNRQAVDTVGNLDKKRYKYNLKEFLGGWKTIAENPIGPKYVAGYQGGTLENYITWAPEDGSINPGTLRISDKTFGYYNNPYHQETIPWWNFYQYDNGYDNWLQHRPYWPYRLEIEHWQAQFDFCELPGDYLGLINYLREKINVGGKMSWLGGKREYYAFKKRIESDWKLYKNTICCERKQPETFFALITNAVKIHGGLGATFTSKDGKTHNTIADPGGVWAYEWSEVEMWPRSEVDKIPEPNPDTGWSNYTIIEFQDNSFPFVFLKPQGYMEGRAPKTFYHQDTRAYNLNEILNSRIPIEFETGVVGSTAPPYTIVMNPGVSDVLGFTGTAGDKSSVSSYPKNFSMMPVGKFRVINSHCPPDWKINTGIVPNDYFYQAGRVVQMFRIPKETLSSIQGKTLISVTKGENTYTRKPRENLFIFDVANAHDGLCLDC